MKDEKQCPAGMAQVKKTALNVKGIWVPVYNDTSGTLKDMRWPLLQCKNSEWSFTQAKGVLTQLHEKGVYASEEDRQAASKGYGHNLCFPAPSPIKTACDRLAAKR